MLLLNYTGYKMKWQLTFIKAEIKIIVGWLPDNSINPFTYRVL
jgi:hypothetical protein